MKRKGERAEEEDRLLGEHGFERAPTEGRRERWVRREGEQQRYTRSEAVKRARKDHDPPATYVQMEDAMIIHKKESDEGSAI
jgi:hypothetical protein